MADYNTKLIDVVRPNNLYPRSTNDMIEGDERVKVQRKALRQMSEEDRMQYHRDAHAVIHTTVAVNKETGDIMVWNMHRNRG